jgi:GcrA cell cycle regulator
MPNLIRTNSCRPWDDEQISRLKELIESGASAVRAAAALKRARSSVQVKARKLGMPFMASRDAKRLRNAKIAAAESRLVAGTGAPTMRNR